MAVWDILSRRSQDKYSPYSPRQVVVSNLNHGTIGVCLEGVSHVLFISPGHYKRALHDDGGGCVCVQYTILVIQVNLF